MQPEAQGYIVHASSMSIIRATPDGIMVKKPGFDPSSRPAIERGIVALRALEEHDSDSRFPRILSEGGDQENRFFSMTNLGTHDLRDAMHDIPLGIIPDLFLSMALDVQTIHDGGFVHRDVKPGNFMVDYSPKRESMEYRGMIDFGMSLRINRSQVGALGGTKNYSHPLQMKKNLKHLRTHPGQDWFALGRTMAHILVGGSEGSFKSGLESGKLEAKVTRAASTAWPDGAGGQSFTDLILFTLRPESLDHGSLPELMRLGMAIVGQNAEITDGQVFSSFADAANLIFGTRTAPIANDSGFQMGSNKRPVRHDMLLIVDSTDSMSDEIDDLREELSEVSLEVSSMPIDLRVDIWSLSDYDRDQDTRGDPVRVVGKRLRSDALAIAIGSLKSGSEQLDDAEAYEAALQDAYLTEKWGPRGNSTRSIVLVGDSYPHGWLTRNYWSQFFWEMKGEAPSKGHRSFDIEDHKRKYGLYLDRHPVARERPWEWGMSEEREVWREAASARSEHDDYSGRGHVKVPSASGSRHRPNVLRALEKCSKERKACVHTIFAGGNLVSRNFMKFASMVGEGTFTQIESGELKIALRALFTSPDGELFRKFSEEVVESSPDTQALNSITSFVYS